MRRTLGTLLVASTCVLMLGCTAAQERNTALGGAIGAGTGALIADRNHTIEGAIVGGAIGAGVGYAVTDD